MKVAMPELFDMIAGSDTGAIIGGNLIIPNPDQSSSQINANFADKTTKFFLDYHSQLYVGKTMPFFWKLIITLFFTVGTTFLVNKGLKWRYGTKQSYEEKIDRLNEILDAQEENITRKT